MRITLAGVCLLMVVTAARATPTTLTVDQTQSSVNETLCLTACSTQCGSDTSPIAGSITLDLDCLGNPTAVTLHDFNFQMTRSLAFHLNYGIICGRFDATTNSIALNYATPGTPQPPTALTGGTFTFANVPETATGTMSYTSTNLVCVGLQSAGRLCADTINLATLGVNDITINGTTTVIGRAVSIIITINSTTPIDPNNPALGTLTTTGTIKASGVVPLPSVDNFVGVLLGTVNQPDLNCESDMDANGVVNGLDVAAYLHALGL